MDTIISNWITLNTPNSNSLNDALRQQHHAAQFVAMVGRHLITQMPDDSNTNMEFIPEKNMLVGNPLPNGMCLALLLVTMELCILDKFNKSKIKIPLKGKTKIKVFDELSQNLADLGVGVCKLKNELHYEIPHHPLDDNATFSIVDKNSFSKNANYRNNAKIVLNEVAKLFKQNELIRIWPHHFDTGAYYVMEKNEKGEAMATIGIGFAIPDGMIDEPYYYLSFWSEKPIDDQLKFTKLNAGRWMMPDWNGAVLTHSDIIKAATGSAQYELVKSFYDSGIETLFNIFNIK